MEVDQEELEETLYYIAGHLNETEPRAQIQIRKIIKAVGCDQALAYLKQAREVERNGGMLTATGKKRRTPGGVYFALVKESCSEDVRARLWPAKDWKTAKAKKKAS